MRRFPHAGSRILITSTNQPTPPKLGERVSQFFFSFLLPAERRKKKNALSTALSTAAFGSRLPKISKERERRDHAMGFFFFFFVLFPGIRALPNKTSKTPMTSDLQKIK